MSIKLARADEKILRVAELPSPVALVGMPGHLDQFVVDDPWEGADFEILI